MTTESMSVHKALSELKILDDRILKTMRDSVFCAANKHFNKKLKGIPVEDYKLVMKSNYDKVTDLIKRQKAIKKAVTKSNATTMVEIAGVPYTVAEAIWMKQSGSESDKNFLTILKSQYASAQGEILAGNRDMDKKVEDYLAKMYGTKESRTDLDEVEDARKKYIDNNTVELVDPINIMKVMLNMEEEINAFMAEVDSALSVSNAITQIEITY